MRPGLPLTTRSLQRNGSSDAGFTLIELIVSLAIAVVVIMLAYSIYHTLISTLRGQERRSQGPDEITWGLQSLTEDLTRLIPVRNPESCGFNLTVDNQAPLLSVECSFCTMVPREDVEGARWADVVHIRYTVSVEGKQAVLVREARPISGPAALEPPTRSVLIQGLTGFRMEIYDGQSWLTTWVAGPESVWPESARIGILHPLNDSTNWVEKTLVIPAGRVIKSKKEKRRE